MCWTENQTVSPTMANNSLYKTVNKLMIEIVALNPFTTRTEDIKR